MTPFETFFKGIRDSEILLFTTFTLDEAVLAKLLDSHQVPHAQRIVVFHDIMRHRNPGFLKSRFHNAMAYTVALDQNHRKKCPVFHSKIWARIQCKGRQLSLKKLVVTSANLSLYHLGLRSSGGTLESFMCFSGKTGALPKGTSLFSPIFLLPPPAMLQKGFKRWHMPPHSIIVDGRSRLNIKSIKAPLIKELIDLGSPKFCAAPFVCDQAIQTHLDPEPHFLVYEGSHPKTGLALHAKVMSFSNCLALGSVNWTSQAMGCASRKPINHETLLLIPANNSLCRVIRGYKSRPLGTLGQDTPADQDPEEPIGEDWLIDRAQRLDAPERAILKIIKNRVTIELLGRHRLVNSIRLHSAGDCGKYVDLKFNRTVIKEPRKANTFAAIIGEGNVELVGRTRGRIIWRIELDYGEYWPVLELHRARVYRNEGHRMANHSSSDHHGHIACDVRDLRQLVIEAPRKGYKKMVAFTSWLHRHGQHSELIPMWCQELAEQLVNRSVQ